MAWIILHLPFVLAYALAAATLSKLVLAHDCSDTNVEDLGEAYQGKSVAELEDGLRWYAHAQRLSGLVTEKTPQVLLLRHWRRFILHGDPLLLPHPQNRLRRTPQKAPPPPHSRVHRPQHHLPSPRQKPHVSATDLHHNRARNSQSNRRSIR